MQKTHFNTVCFPYFVFPLHLYNYLITVQITLLHVPLIETRSIKLHEFFFSVYFLFIYFGILVTRGVHVRPLA